MTPSFSGAAVSSVKSGVNKVAAEQGGHYPPTSYNDYQYPGLNLHVLFLYTMLFGVT